GADQSRWRVEGGGLAAERRRLVETWLRFFRGCGYREHVPASIVSHDDPSVLFTGSTVSVLKPYLSSGVPATGYCLAQPCVRTRNAPTLLDDAARPHWCSYFTQLGTLTRAERLDE